MKKNMGFVLPPFLCVASVGFVSAKGIDETQQTEQGIEVIKVHAEKKAKELSSVSTTVSLYTQQELEDFKLKDTTELSTLAANVKITQNAAEGTPPAISIRGVSLLDYNTANTAPVAIYVDDAVGGSVNHQIVNLFDVKQVEILKGPQGTLFGRNTTGGAILVFSNEPEQDFSAHVKAGGGNQDYRLLEAMLNQPLTDNSAARIVVNHQEYDYSTINLHPQSPKAGLEQTNIRAMYKYNGDNWDLLLKARAEDWQGNVKPPANIGVVDASGNPCAPNDAGSTKCFDGFGYNVGTNDFHVVNVDNFSPHETDAHGFSAKLTFDLTDNSQLIYIGALNHLQRYSAYNCDASPAELCKGALGVETDAINHEIRLENNWESIAWTIGAFYLNEEIKQDNFSDIFRAFRGLGILPNEYTTTFLYDNELEVTASSLFTEFEFSLTEKWFLNLGGRYTDESTEYHTVSRVDTILDNSLNDDSILTAIGCFSTGESHASSFGANCPNWDLTGKVSDNNLSGSASVRYQFNSGSNVYYTVASGFKSGGYNAGLLATKEEAERAEYGAEKLLAHEIGSKISLKEYSSFIQASAFYYDYTDQQVFQNQPSAVEGAPPIQVLDNVGKSTIYGVDLDWYFKASEGLNTRLSIGYLPKAEAEFEDAVTGETKRSRLPLASKWNVGGRLNYTFSDLSVMIGFDHQSDFYFDQNENPYAEQKAFTLWNAGLIYNISDNFAVRIWGKNLTDVEYSHLKFDLINFLGMLEDFRAEGRRYGVEATLSF
ncbi:TonB-dependent receptor [Catenovulum agarivorans]|uniref:TonB-dependent receptor n=1 Tax=Catenovulum agarivorans TaxID=1172192 RepID=UPI0002D8CFE2|nr:TonB-dependent receptor [Catenovulum agarivorans]